MAVAVTAKRDLFNHANGTLEVPVDTAGTVIAVQIPPLALMYRVEFATSPTPVQRWCSAEVLNFTEGPVGGVRCVFELTNQLLSSTTYPDYVSSTDLIIGEQYHARRETVKLQFLSGLILYITTNTNSGDLDFRLDFQQ